MAGNITKVLFVNHVAWIGGAEISLLDLAARLDRSRFDPIAALPGPGELDTEFRRRGIETVFAPLRRLARPRNPVTAATQLWSLLRTVPRLASVIRTKRVGLVHANSNTAQIYCGPAGSRTGVPVVWHSRDLVDLGRTGKWMAARASRAVAISETVAGHLGRYVTDRNKLVTIHNGIDSDLFRPTVDCEHVRRELGVEEDAALVATVGHLMPWKKHALFLEAASLVSRELPKARFIVVGEDMFGDHPAYCRQLKAMASRCVPGGRATLTGYRCDVPRLLNGIDVLVHCADREPFGRAVAEAMSVGKPVVAVGRAGPAEIIRDGVDGVLVEPDDAEAVARAVVGVLTSPGLAARLGAEARKRITRDYDIRQCVSSMEGLYEELRS